MSIYYKKPLKTGKALIVSCDIIVSCELVDCGRRSLNRCGGSSCFHLHGVHQEAELVAQRLMAVRQPDLGHVCPPDVVPVWAVLQVVWTQEVLLLLVRGWVGGGGGWLEASWLD